MSRRPNRSAVLGEHGALPSKPNLPPEEQVERGTADYTPITLLDKWKFIKRAIADKRLSAGDIRCLVAIVDRYNSNKGRAWPSYNDISQQTGLSLRTIARCVEKLHALGIIHKLSGGTGRANTYRPAFGEAPGEINSPDAHATQKGKSATAGSPDKHVTPDEDGTPDYDGSRPLTPMAVDPCHTWHTIPLTPRSNSVGEYRGIPALGGAPRAGGALRPPGGAPEPEGNDGFEQFWANYPKREGRTLAKQAYSRVVANGIAPDTLIAKARQYAEAKADADPKWLKMPANWLKEECWLEDPQPPHSREPKPARAAKAVVKGQNPARAAEAVVKKKPKPAVNGDLAITDTRHASFGVPKAGRDTVAKARSAQKRQPKWVESIPEFIRPGASVFDVRTNQLARVVGYGSKWSVRIERERDGAQELVHYRALSLAVPKPASLPAPKPAPDVAEPATALPPAVAPSLTATKPTEPPKSQPRTGGEAPAKSAARRRGPPSFEDTSMMLRVFAKDRTVNVKRLLQDYFCVQQSSDIPAQALDGLLTRIGLDEKSITAIWIELLDPELPHPVKAPWFEIGASVWHDEHGCGCVVLGSECLANNDGKVQIQFDNGEDKQDVFVDPTELILPRIWHPLHGPGELLFGQEDEDGLLNVLFDDKDGNSFVKASEIRPCVTLGKEYLANRQSKAIWHQHLGRCVIVGEEGDGKPIVIFDNRDVSRHLHIRSAVPESSIAKPVTQAKLSDSCSALGQTDKPFTVGAIAAEGPKSLETANSATCSRDTVRAQEGAETRGERKAAIDAIMRELGML